MASKQPRTRGGASSLSNPPPLLHRINQFLVEEHQERYHFLSRLTIVANRFCEFGDLKIIGIRDEVQCLMNGIEWTKFVEVKEPIVRELLLKLLASYHFYKMPRVDYDWEGTIEFRLGGVLHTMSISEFKVKLGFYQKQFLEIERYHTSTFEF